MACERNRQIALIGVVSFTADLQKLHCFIKYRWSRFILLSTTECFFLMSLNKTACCKYYYQFGYLMLVFYIIKANIS